MRFTLLRPGALQLLDKMVSSLLHCRINLIVLFVELGVKTKLAEISSGEYFGELALLNDEPRQASVVALSDTECFSLDQAKFESILGPLQDIMNREAEEREALAAIGTKIIFEDLEVLSTLGTGTFGRVKIAHNRKTSKVYALKVLQKAQVVQFKQKANVVHEKQLLSQCNHPFILKLHQSFKDATCLYLLLEVFLKLGPHCGIEPCL